MFWETMFFIIIFDTFLVGFFDFLLDVLVERYVFLGFLVVSWFLVIIDSVGFFNGVRVIGYVVYVDGFKVVEVVDVIVGSILLEFF